MNLSGFKQPIASLLVFLLLSAYSCAQVSFSAAESSVENVSFETATLLIAGKQLETELASTPLQRRTGLSHRPSLAKNSGMLFIYSDSAIRYFTMRETLIPLDIAFIDRHGVITEILEMQARSLENYRSRIPVQYALEVNAGWFEGSGISPGQTIDLTGIDMDAGRAEGSLSDGNDAYP